jgi:tryptophan-rich sensory protein/uncharacterized protein YbjT (DUF2867 family)
MILVTGATGYIGGRLLPEIVRSGRSVRCLVRRPQFHVAPGVDVVRGDLSDPDVVRRAVVSVETAYFLVHAMNDTPDYVAMERRTAAQFGRAAKDAGVRRIVFLGGLGRGAGLSEHLASRHAVGDALRESGVPVIEFRASIVIGAGSISFDLVRTLVDKLPVMITPRWVRTAAQPIAIDDVIAYLVEALDGGPGEGGIFEIGGAERVSYGDIMRALARRRGVTRLMIPVPALSPRISSLWLSLVVPRLAKVGRLLIDGVRNETTVGDDAALRCFRVRPIGVVEAVARAIAEEPVRPPALSGARSVAALAACLAATFCAAAVGVLLSFDGVGGWYRTIAKPAWTPPGWVFGPVWSALYAMMAVAAWRVWRRDGLRESRLACVVFAAQLVLNAAWSWIFFGLHRPGVAFVEILLLWGLIVATGALFWVRDRTAGALMAPYAAWVAFAAVLNGAIAWMNRS